MLAPRNTSLRNLVRTLDIVVLAAAMAISAVIQSALYSVVGFLKPLPSFGVLATLVGLTIPFWVVAASVLELDRTFERSWTKFELTFDVVKLHAIGFVGMTVILFVTQLVVNRLVVINFIATSFILTLMSRALLGRWRRYQHALGHSRTRILVVGAASPDLAAFLENARRDEFAPQIVGYVGEPGAVHVGGDLTHLGAITDLERVLHDHPIDRVLFFPPHHSPNAMVGQLATCETVGVLAELALEFDAPARAAPNVVANYGRPFVSFDIAPKRPELLAIKHTCDIIGAAILVIALSPIFIVTSLAILVTMGRPILFTQERAGLFGRPFRVFKFRTMHANAAALQPALRPQNELAGPVFKLDNDPRITRLGRILRRTSIDELPQLLNVLLGSMSLVGPRPLDLREQQQMRGWYRRRMSMKPGLTCIWQVSGRSNIDFEDWMRLDLEYVDRWSLWLDLTLLVRTIPAVLSMRGAR